MIDQGSSELNIIIGVRNHDFDAAIKAIYDIFKIQEFKGETTIIDFHTHMFPDKLLQERLISCQKTGDDMNPFTDGTWKEG